MMKSELEQDLDLIAFKQGYAIHISMDADGHVTKEYLKEEEDD